MKKLVLIEAGVTLALQGVDDGMEEEFDAAEDNAAGDEPHGSGVQQAVGGHAKDPNAGGPGGIGTLNKVWAAFALREELSLEGEIHQCMPCSEQEEHLRSRGPVMRGKWQQAIHAIAAAEG